MSDEKKKIRVVVLGLAESGMSIETLLVLEKHNAVASVKATIDQIEILDPLTELDKPKNLMELVIPYQAPEVLPALEITNPKKVIRNQKNENRFRSNHHNRKL
jgi:hypothetical protein